MSGPFAKDMREVEVLYYYDGPLLTHYSAQGIHYIVSWVDYTEKNTIWHAIEISTGNLKLYLDNKITLLQVMQQSRGIFRCLDNFIDKHRTATGELVQFDDLDESLLPTDKSFLR